MGIMMPVMDALREVHQAGLLHRDISPDNIYLTSSAQVKLLDFGAARYFAGEQSKSLSVILKQGYAPEEQYRSSGKQGTWTDVYAVGATLYKVLTGKTPPDALDRLAEDTLTPPSRLGVAIPAAAEQALLKALHIKAKQRFQTMGQFQQALLGDFSPPERASRKNQLAFSLIVLAAAAALFAAAVAVVWLGRDRNTSAVPDHRVASPVTTAERDLTASPPKEQITAQRERAADEVKQSSVASPPEPSPQEMQPGKILPPNNPMPDSPFPAAGPVPQSVRPQSPPKPVIPGGRPEFPRKWRVEWRGGRTTALYSGSLAITNKLNDTTYAGVMVINTPQGQQVYQKSLISIDNTRVEIRCSDPSLANYPADNFFLNLAGNSMKGYDRDVQGNIGKGVIFTALPN
jgi:serine/threonine protein kinase